MKKLFCLLLGIGVLWMTACEAKGTEKETNAKTAAETAVFRMAENGVTPVVYGEEPLPAVYAAAKELTAFLNGKGFNVEYHDDFTAGKEPPAREILIGETGREESKRAYAELGELSYLIRVDGEKLVVAGSSPRITAYAVTVLEKMFASGTETVIPGTTLNYPENPANFTGFVLYENQVWTSMTAHTHLAVTLSTQPWTAAGMTDRVFGGAVMNNYTPDGCHICTSAGIAADGCTGVAVRGNSFSLFLGNWCEGRGAFRARIASENPENCSGDFQPGFEETGIAGRTGCFITNAYNENGETQTLKEAILHEAPVTVSAERFRSEPQ